MPSPRSFTGTIASRGYAEGPLFALEVGTVAYRTSGEPETEAGRLKDAIAAAAAEVAILAASTGGEAAEIIEFQLAMLEDDALSEPALSLVAEGADAAAAWHAALAEQTQIYLTSDSEYFRARATDLGDISDRVLRILTGTDELKPPPGAVLFATDITPSQFLGHDWSHGGGIVLLRGSPASHVAMLARARRIPMLVGVAGLAPEGEEPVLVDAELGRVTLSPEQGAVSGFRSEAAAALQVLTEASAIATRPAMTADGTPIAVHVNIASPDEVDTIDIATCDGVGLMRTEFLYGSGLPDEETQYMAYRRVLDWAAGKPVVIRTVDAGGDKPVPGFTVDESNPFLGLRGIRLALARPHIFRTQIRALLRAARAGNLKVMFPMVSVVGEYHKAVSLFGAIADELAAEGVPHAAPPLGIMVEVPAVAIAPEQLHEAAFFSIGSNDLTQYVMAASRDNGTVANLNDVTHPAVLSLITNVARFGAQAGIPVSLCGDAGSDPAAIPALLATGLRSLSVSPAQLAMAKRAISSVRLG
ncbi:MAG: phosphoenolpyruvate--protein phosphotransferase [Devosia sp.]